MNILLLAEMEDVDLPTCSQIVSKGLPVLNPTGMLVKKNQKLPVKPASRFSSRAASLTGNDIQCTECSPFLKLCLGSIGMEVL